MSQFQPSKELQALVDAACNETITETEIRKLEALISSDDESLEYYVEQMALNFGIARLSSPQASSIDTSQFEAPDSSLIDFEEAKDTDMSTTQTSTAWTSPTKTNKATKVPRAFLIAATLFVLVGSGLLLLTTFEDDFRGQAKRVSSTLDSTWDSGDDDRLAFGGAESAEKVTLDDGTIVIARPGSQYSNTGPRSLDLQSGELYLIVAKSETPFVVNTRDGRIVATGTRFNVSANQKTLAAVAQGKVSLESTAGNIELGAGQQGVLEVDKQPLRGPARRLSYLVNWAKEALKQEKLLVEQGEKQSGLIAMDPNGQESRLSLRKYHVDVYIEDGVARTTIDQTFFNHYPWNTEGTFYFPLPSDASVSRLAMYVFGKLNEGGMVTRERGQQIYTDILYQRRDPALLEMMEGNTFKMRIFPLEGRQEKRILLSYSQTLEELYGTTKYWFPMDHTNDVAQQLSIKVHIKDGAKKFEPHSSTHEVQSKIDGNDLLLEYSVDNVKPDQDFLLGLVPKKKSLALGQHSIGVTEHQGQKYLSARFRPDLVGIGLDPKPRQWIVLNDVSASRSSIDIRAQHHILKRLIAEADDKDSVYLIDLNTTARDVTNQPISVRDARAKRLSDRETLRRIGATNLAGGLEAVGAAIRKHNLGNPHLLYLGDGVATDGERELAKLVERIPGKCKFVGIGVGKKSDLLFLKAAADRTGGTFTTINPNEDINWRVFDLLASLNTSRITNLSVELLDEDGDPVEAIAYPTKRVLAAGEALTVNAMCNQQLPDSIKLTGRVNGRRFEQAIKVSEANPDADYIPRIWAKRHIDELLKSDMSEQGEIIRLSREFYVVTPFTSLIVLEDDAMYQEYDVERGRTDHWARYNAPAEIEVVSEPVDWSQWSWYRDVPRADDEAVVTIKPKSIQEIVNNIQLRIDAPFYLMNPRPNEEHNELIYRIADQGLDASATSSRSLAFWYLMIAGQKEPAIELLESFGNLSSVGTQNVSSVEKQISLAKLPMGLSSVLPPDSVSGFRSMDVLFKSDDREMKRRSLLTGSQDFLRRNEAMFEAALPSFSSFRFKKKRRSLSGLATQGMKAPYDSGLVPAQIGLSFSKAWSTRMAGINRDIREFNRQHGHYNNRWYGWSSIDLRESGSGYWNNGISEILDISGEEIPDFRIEELADQDAISLQQFNQMDLHGRLSILGGGGFGGGGLGGPPHFLQQLRLTDVSDEISREPALGWDLRPSRAPLPVGSLLTILGRRRGWIQPGIAATSAVDLLLPRLQELNEKSELEPLERAEKKAIETAISKSSAVGARLESTSPFWNSRGWNYQPRANNFVQPVVQAYPHYAWSFDLTRYAEGLNSTSIDILQEVLDQFGSQRPTGSISVEARRLITDSRRGFTPIAIRFEDEKELLVGKGSRFSYASTSSMSLQEQLVCDGKNIYHIYPELGLVSRRKATSLRLSGLQSSVPYFLPDLDSFAGFDISVVESNETSFTIKLVEATDAPQNERKLDDESEQKVNGKSSHLLIKADHQGRILSEKLVVNEQVVWSVEYEHQPKAIEVVLRDQDGKELFLESLSVRPIENADTAFEYELEPMVVFDLPIKKPRFYIQQLEALCPSVEFEEDIQDNQRLEKLKDATLAEDCEKAIRIRHHLALSYLQDYQWRRWGGGNPNNNGNLQHIYALNRRAGLEDKLGELTIFGSNGNYLTAQSKEYQKFKDNPLHFFYRNRSNREELWKNRSELESGLVGHIGAFHAAAYTTDQARFDQFERKYPQSPLALALTMYHGSGIVVDRLIKLNKSKRWQGLALLMAANSCRNAEEQKRLAIEVFRWDSSLKENQTLPEPSESLLSICRTADPERFAQFCERQFNVIEKSDSIVRMMLFAERYSRWCDESLSNKAYDWIEEKLSLTREQAAFTKRLAFARCLWAGGKHVRAWKTFSKIMEGLQRNGVEPSPALLAEMARIAQQAGNHDQAIKFEELALEAEFPHLPNAINLNAFRQRYGWLWQQYLSRAKGLSKDKPQFKKQAEQLVTQATRTWDQWRDVDRDNPELPGKMASLLSIVGKQDQSWEYLSTLIDQNPRDASTYSLVGNWFREAGDLKQAVKWMEQAPQWDTANPRWLFEYGKLLKQAGRKQEATVQFRKITEGKWAPGLQNYVQQAHSELQ